MAETLDPEKLQEYRDIFSFFDRLFWVLCLDALSRKHLTGMEEEVLEKRSWGR